MQIFHFVIALLATAAAPALANPAPAVKSSAYTDAVSVSTENTASLRFDLSKAVTPAAKDVLQATGFKGAAVAKRDDTTYLEKRTPGCMLWTDGKDFTGNSLYFCLSSSVRGACLDVNPDWAVTLSSIGPDSGTTCQVYTGSGCSGYVSNSFTAPGYGDLGIFDNNVWSIVCTW